MNAIRAEDKYTHTYTNMHTHTHAHTHTSMHNIFYSIHTNFQGTVVWKKFTVEYFDVKFVCGKIFCPLECPMNKEHYLLFIVKNISFVQFSSCHIRRKLLASNFSQTTVCKFCTCHNLHYHNSILRITFPLKLLCILYGFFTHGT